MHPDLRPYRRPSHYALGWISGEVLLTASCYMRKGLEEMVLPPFAYDFDAMCQEIERFRAMQRTGTRLIFGHQSGSMARARLPRYPALTSHLSRSLDRSAACFGT